MNINEQFWLYDPLVLFKHFTLLPRGDMSKSEKFNAITRLLLLITIILFFIGCKEWYVVLIFGLLVIIFLDARGGPKPIEEHFTNGYPESVRPNTRPIPYNPCGTCGYDPNIDTINRMYELTPAIQFNHDNEAKRSYMNAKYELDPLREAPGFTDIWRAEPGDCGEFNMIPDPETIFPEEGLDGDDHPGQCNYIVRSKIDHLPIVQDGSNGLIAVRAQAEQAFNDNTALFRNTIQGEHSDHFLRERKHNCSDVRLGRVGGGN